MDVRALLKPAIVRLGYRSRPAFLIIGAAKCGTTALHRYLCTHPQIHSAWDKEVHFFDQNVSYSRGPSWYHSRFPLPHKLGNGGVTFEATPDYLYFRHCAERIHRYDANLKLIAVLRDPIDRAYSFWNMLRNFHAERGRAILDQAHRFDPRIGDAYRELFGGERFPEFDEMVRREMETGHDSNLQIQPNLVNYGFYAEQIERYWGLFGREQLLILENRALAEQTRAVLDRITDFLELPRCEWGAGIDKKEHEFPYASEISAGTRELLREYYRPHNERLLELLGEDFDWRRDP